MATNLFKKISTRAKAIQRIHKSKTWKACMKQAWAEYRNGKITGTRKKKKAAPRRKRRSGSKIRRKKVGSIRKNSDRIDRKRVNVTIGSVASHKSAIKKGLKIRLEKKAGQRELTTRKPTRKKLTREIAKLKKEIRAYC